MKYDSDCLTIFSACSNAYNTLILVQLSWIKKKVFIITQICFEYHVPNSKQMQQLIDYLHLHIFIRYGMCLHTSICMYNTCEHVHKHEHSTCKNVSKISDACNNKCTQTENEF